MPGRGLGPSAPAPRPPLPGRRCSDRDRQQQHAPGYVQDVVIAGGNHDSDHDNGEQPGEQRESWMLAAHCQPHGVGAHRRPSDVQARHRREVVLTIRHIAGGAAGDRVVLGHDVEDPGQREPRRRQRHQPEDQQRQRRHHRQGAQDSAERPRHAGRTPTATQRPAVGSTDGSTPPPRGSAPNARQASGLAATSTSRFSERSTDCKASAFAVAEATSVPTRLCNHENSTSPTTRPTSSAIVRRHPRAARRALPLN